MVSSARTTTFDTLMTLIRLTSAVLAVYWVAIFVATHLPGSSLPKLGSDKAYHLMAFFGLSVLLSWVVAQKVAGSGVRIVVVLAITISYAIFDEWSQQFVPNRSPDAADVLADACGAALGVIPLRVGCQDAAPALQTQPPTRGLKRLLKRKRQPLQPQGASAVCTADSASHAAHS